MCAAIEGECKESSLLQSPALASRLRNVLLVPQVSAHRLNNKELDKLVGALGRSKVTWRRALLLHDWLQSIGHPPDDRLCTTLIRCGCASNVDA